MLGISSTSSQCVCLFVSLYLCIWQCRISFLMDHWLFKNRSICRVFLTLSHMLYLCICELVFVYLTVQNIIFDVLVPLAFQKYSIIRVYEVFLTWWQTNERTTKQTKNRVNLEQVKLWNNKKIWLLQFIPILHHYFIAILWSPYKLINIDLSKTSCRYRYRYFSDLTHHCC